MSDNATMIVAIFVLTTIGGFLLPLLNGMPIDRKLAWAAVYILLEIILILVILQVSVHVVFVILLGMILGYIVFRKQ